MKPHKNDKEFHSNADRRHGKVDFTGKGTLRSGVITYKLTPTNFSALK
jgi:hypothetical protein